MIYQEIGGNTVDRFALTRMPNGGYCVDGRFVPVRDDTLNGVDDRKSVIAIHAGLDNEERLGWAVLGVDPKK